MRLLPWDPDVETVISRIESNVLDLQPDFQRGEVWSKAKKQRLIDSILRDWHVPPLHVVENTVTKRQEVLDGQQRLVAIRDFARGEFEVDGSVEPADAAIERLRGLRYRELPEDAKRQFDQFTLRVYRIVDYKSSEPAELFLRLNQPTNLTGAEQRNAFFGPVRQQIKDLVEALPTYGLDKSLIGFTNSRMAYDDVLCRVALTLERGSLTQKISANDLVAMYRSEAPVSDSTHAALSDALELFGAAGRLATEHPRYNKATIYSWLIFCVRGASMLPGTLLSEASLAEFMAYFESERMIAANGGGVPGHTRLTGGLPTEWLLKTYDDRSTSRVADVSSVVLRDVAIWLAYTEFIETRAGAPGLLPPKPLAQLVERLSTLDEDAVAKAAIELAWGNLR